MSNVVYVAYKVPLKQHPQKVRIGVCNEMPTLEEGWGLYSTFKTPIANDIYLDILGMLNEIREKIMTRQMMRGFFLVLLLIHGW